MQELFSNRVAQAVFSVRDDQPWMTASYSHQKLVPTSDFDIEDHLRFAECKQFIEDQEYNCKVTVERSTFDVEALLIQVNSFMDINKYTCLVYCLLCMTCFL